MYMTSNVYNYNIGYDATYRNVLLSFLFLHHLNPAPAQDRNVYDLEHQHCHSVFDEAFEISLLCLNEIPLLFPASPSRLRRIEENLHLLLSV